MATFALIHGGGGSASGLRNEDIYRLRFLRGPEGIIGLAELS
jgi:hypothetical protein